MLKYSEVLRDGIKKADLSLAQICRRLKSNDVSTNKSYLSKLQSGKCPPASDKLSLALADLLQIDQVDLLTSAYLEKLPPEVIKRIRETG